MRPKCEIKYFLEQCCIVDLVFRMFGEGGPCCTYKVVWKHFKIKRALEEQCKVQTLFISLSMYKGVLCSVRKLPDSKVLCQPLKHEMGDLRKQSGGLDVCKS